jgi:hypothetical protein
MKARAAVGYYRRQGLADLVRNRRRKLAYRREAGHAGELLSSLAQRFLRTYIFCQITRGAYHELGALLGDPNRFPSELACAGIRRRNHRDVIDNFKLKSHRA